MRLSIKAAVWAFAVAQAILASNEALAYGRTDASHLHAEKVVRAPIGWAQFCTQNPRDCIASIGSAAPAKFTEQKLRELDGVNRYFNKSIQPVTDQDQYGVVEYWTYADSGKGDCEEYVLEKRRKLIELGWLPSQLLVSVVIDKEGSGHAVLSVITDQGDYILDNVTDELLVWSQSGLTFVKRQSQSDPNVWIDLGRVLGRMETTTSSTRAGR